MEAILSKLLSELNTSVFVLLVLLIATGWMLYKIGGWKQTFSHHAGRIEKAERIADTVISIQTKVDLIYSLVNPNSPTRAASPISLTPVGHEIVTAISAEDIFKAHAVKLAAIVEGRNPKNAYDIQQISFDVAKKEFFNLLNENELRMVKEQAFKRGILAEDVMTVFGVLLRNKILADKNIPIAEVDKKTT